MNAASRSLRRAVVVVLVGLTAAVFGGACLAPPAAARLHDSAARRLVLTAAASTLQPRAGDAVSVTALARDRGGRPVRGARITLAWRLPQGTESDVALTGRSGVAVATRVVGAAPAGQAFDVAVRANWRQQTRRVTLHLTVAADPVPVERLAPGDLVYSGAFRLPGPSGGSSWGWSGDGLTFCPTGDPGGEADGYPGSLYGIGHDWQHFVSEVSVPAPVISAARDPAELPAARTLQPFADVRGALYPDLGEEMLRADLEYAPPGDGYAEGRLFMSWGRHVQEGAANATHMWCALDLADPRPAGPWSVGGYEDYVTCDYLFSVDPAWAAANAPGMTLASGRYRDGGQGAMGPSIFLFAPGAADAAPPGGALPALPLLLYDNVWNGGTDVLNEYQHSDNWAGAAWLSAGGRGAVVFAGTKGGGECWYGFADGTVWPDEPPYPPAPPGGQRGWWSTSFAAELLFYDPADLAAVAAGTLEADQPQPYATLPLDEYLFAPRSAQQKDHVGAIAFDRAHGRLFVMEPLADGDGSIVHVWSLR